MIQWEGTNTERNCHWKALSNTFIELYDHLIEKKLIGSTDYNLYDSTVLAKFDKTENDPEFLDEDGEVIYEKVQEFVEKHNLTDKEIWEMIGSDNGNAYYQKFYAEDRDGELVEISEKNFDKNGNYFDSSIVMENLGSKDFEAGSEYLETLGYTLDSDEDSTSTISDRVHDTYFVLSDDETSEELDRISFVQFYNGTEESFSNPDLSDSCEIVKELWKRVE